MKTQLSCANRSLPNRINHADHFAEVIESEGYSKGSIDKYWSNAQALREALVSAKLTPSDLTDELMNQLARPIVDAASAKDKKHCLYRLNRFRDYLIENASAPARPIPPLDMSPRAVLKREYETYLRVQRGLSGDTIYHCLQFYDQFLTAKFGTGLFPFPPMGGPSCSDFWNAHAFGTAEQVRAKPVLRPGGAVTTGWRA